MAGISMKHRRWNNGRCILRFLPAERQAKERLVVVVVYLLFWAIRNPLRLQIAALPDLQCKNGQAEERLNF